MLLAWSSESTVQPASSVSQHPNYLVSSFVCCLSFARFTDLLQISGVAWPDHQCTAIAPATSTHAGNRPTRFAQTELFSVLFRNIHLVTILTRVHRALAVAASDHHRNCSATRHIQRTYSAGFKVRRCCVVVVPACTPRFELYVIGPL